MKKVKDMNLSELAVFISSHLKSHGINVVLSDGVYVSIYSSNNCW